MLPSHSYRLSARGRRTKDARGGRPCALWHGAARADLINGARTEETVTDINPYIFRAYDVRGKVGIDVLPEVFGEVGRAYGTLVRRRGGPTGAIAMDNRTASP